MFEESELISERGLNVINELALLESLPEAALVINPVRDRIEYANRKLLRLLSCGAEKLLSHPASRLFGASLGQLVSFTREVDELGEGMTEQLTLCLDDREMAIEVSASVMTAFEHRLMCFLVRDREKMQIWRMKNSAQKNHQFGLLQWYSPQF